MSKSTLVCLTSYNRPTLVRDAIQSVLEQDTADLRLVVLDDGSNDETRAAIRATLDGYEVLPVGANLNRPAWHGIAGDDEGFGSWMVGTPHGIIPVLVVWLPGRSLEDRRATISYSRNLNAALNRLLLDEKYVTYLCDDDAFYPESVRARVEFMEKNPDVHVCYGRSRSVQFDAGGFNSWSHTLPPKAGRHYPRPTGARVLIHDGAAAKTYFDDPDERDPETGLNYVEEAVWHPGPITYAAPYRIDHNQCLHRSECLRTCRQWPDGASLGGKMFWGESPQQWSVGDAAFFTLLGEPPGHQFWGVDAFVCTKKFHAFSTGIVSGEQRE